MRNLWLFQKTRLKILLALIDNPEKCCILGSKLNITKNLLSYHLKILEQKNIVKFIKNGRIKKYYINPDKINFVKKVINILQET
ncbi:MAG: ArsR/SmtB family transcription factor [Minisyncoccia bacterium]